MTMVRLPNGKHQIQITGTATVISPTNFSVDYSEHNHLVVDRYIAEFIPAQALCHALDSGLIDALAEATYNLEQLAQGVAAEPQSTSLQLALLVGNGVAACSDNGVWCLTDQFAQTLRFRDLLEAKLEFSALLAPDLLSAGADFFTSLQRFMSSARTFELFDYQRCMTVNEANLAATARWVKLTAAYTRYEAATLTDNLDLLEHRRLLDIGGNNGELALQLCRQLPELEATVVDLPVVCELGRRHLAETPECSRVNFIDRNLLEQKAPGHYDLVTLKSLLHDWPNEGVEHFIERAWDALEPGGQLIIFERIARDHGASLPSYGDLPIFVFARFYRSPALYMQFLEQRKFVDIEQRSIELDWPFTLITARKPKSL